MVAVATYYGPKVTGTGDPIDALMGFTGGDILRMPDGVPSGGEYDSYDLSRSEARRLVGGRLLSRRYGLPADVLAAAALENGCRHADTVDGFVAWYLAQGLAGLDVRRDGSRCAVDDMDPDAVVEYDAWCALTADGPTDDEYRDSLAALIERADAVPTPVVPVPVTGHGAPDLPAGAPSWVVEWFGRLEHAPKRAYLAAYAAHRLEGAPAPVEAASWAGKVRRQWANRETFHGKGV